MISFSFSPQLGPSLQILSVKVKNPDPLRLLPKSQIKSQQIGFITKPKLVTSITTVHNLFEKMSEPVLFHKSVVPLVASLAIFLWSSPAEAGFLSGFPGIESVPGPQLPEIEFLNRFNEENQKKYAEADARFKESPILKKLLEQSRLNKEKNKQETLDKYCIRGAEWGVGDCSAEGMSPDDREKFIAMLKEKAGVK